MSFRRHQSFAINNMTYLDNRLAQFTNVPMYTDNLFVKKNTDICGNLWVGGNLTVNGDIYATNFRASGNFYLDGYVLVPAGSITIYTVNSAPSGWLICDGSLKTKSDYSELFAVIGHSYQYDLSYDQAVYFRLPDLRGRTIIGAGDNIDPNISNRVFGAKGGAETHTLTVDEMPSHNHIYNDAYFAEATGGGANNLPGSGSTDNDNSFRWRTQAGGASTSPADINTSNTGSGQAHNNMQPYIVLHYIIKY